MSSTFSRIPIIASVSNQPGAIGRWYLADGIDYLQGAARLDTSPIGSNAAASTTAVG